MADSDVQISFAADTGDLKAGLQEARTAIQGLAVALASLNTALGSMNDALQTALKPPSTSAATSAFGQIVDGARAMEQAIAVAVLGGNQTIAAKTTQTAATLKAEWDRTVGSLVNGFGQGLLKVAQGAETWQKFSNHLLGQIETKAVATVSKLVSHWIYGEMAKTSATTAGAEARGAVEKTAAAQSRMLSFADAEKQIFNNALKAASAAYSGMAGIPIIGPALGAGAAAVTFTAVEAFGQMASAAGGYDIPSGVNPITQLHQNEMVLPAQIAQPLRGMLGDYATGQNSVGAASVARGDTHLHLHMGAGADGPSLQRWFDQHGDKIAKSLSTQSRRGARFT